MALLPAVNEKATREAVREFFDSEWPRIVNMADMGYVDLKSVEISDMPSARSFGNANDERFTNHANAVYYYDAVVHAIKVMTQPHRHFMWLRYVRYSLIIFLTLMICELRKAAVISCATY